MLTIVTLILIATSIGADSIGLDIDPAKCDIQHGIELNLSRSGIERVGKLFANSLGRKASEDTAITCIHLEHNKISEIENGTFDNLPNLTYLNLAENPLSIDRINFGNQPSIEVLVLDNALKPQIIRHIFHGFLPGPENKAELIRKVGTITLTPSLQLPNLKKLYLRNNRIKGIFSDVWINEIWPQLTHLYLSDNEIVYTQFMKYMTPSLRYLYLDNNNITAVNDVSLENLTLLSLNRNQINQLCGGPDFCDGLNLTTAVNLTALSVSDSGIEFITPKAFKNTENLEFLVLSGNKLESLPNEVFTSLPKLNMLSLAHNRLILMPNFQNLQSLKYLSLAHNKLQVIKDDSFNGLSNLEKLSLKANKLSEISPNAFKNLPSLRHLDLSENNLKSLPVGWISPDISHLHLNKNLFTTLENLSLNGATQLEYLNISDNPINYITIHELISLPKNASVEIGNICNPKAVINPYTLHSQLDNVNKRSTRSIPKLIDGFVLI